jgi:hypothetical protein
MSTVEQRMRGLVMELESLHARIGISSEEGAEGALAHLEQAIEHLHGAISCLTDPPEWNR